MRKVALVPSAALALALLVGYEPAQAVPPTPGHAPSSVTATPTQDDDVTMRKLQVLFGTSGELPPASLPRAERYRTFVRSQMALSAFYDNVAWRLFFLANQILDGTFPHTLEKATIGGRTAYYLDKPCAAKDLVQVQPWWDLKSKVWVCSDAYRPEITVDARIGKVFCEAGDNPADAKGPLCRCGEHLLSCARDVAQHRQMAKAWTEEPTRTIEHIVKANRPLSDVLTTNESVRSDLGDLFYARSAYYQTGKLDYPKADEKAPPRLRPRPPMFAGIYTMPHYRYIDSAPRNLVAQYWTESLCTPFFSARVDAHQLLEASGEKPQLRQDKHMELTTRVGCQDCHARLEYGMFVFDNFPTRRRGMRWQPFNPPETATRFYATNHLDQRGEGPATPQWLGQMMGKQPEFNTCTVKKTEELIYGGAETPTPVHDALVKSFANGQNLARLMEDTVVARFVGTAAIGAGR